MVGDPHIAAAAGGDSGPDSIAAWTASREHLALMAELQAAGIPAGAVMNGPDLLDDDIAELVIDAWWGRCRSRRADQRRP